MTQPAFPFQTPFIKLRPFEPSDIPALAVYLAHPALAGRRYLPWAYPEYPPLPEKTVGEVIEKWRTAEKAFTLAVEIPEDGTLAGYAGCDWRWDPHAPNVSVVIASPYQRQGYGSEVVGLLLRYLFEYTPAHNVSCWIADWNQAGRLFARQHGFREVGQMRRAGLHKGTYFDLVVCDILRPEWRVYGGGFRDAA